MFIFVVYMVQGTNSLRVNHLRGEEQDAGVWRRRSGHTGCYARGGNSVLARTNTVCFLQIPPRATRRAPADKHGEPYITPRRACRCAQSRNTYNFVSTPSQREASPGSEDISPARTHQPKKNDTHVADLVSTKMYTKHFRAKVSSVNV